MKQARGRSGSVEPWSTTLPNYVGTVVNMLTRSDTRALSSCSSPAPRTHVPRTPGILVNSSSSPKSAACASLGGTNNKRERPTLLLGGQSIAKRFASSLGLGSEKKKHGLSLLFSTACLPHPDKMARGGEDAYFASPALQTFGVADGVGGWASVPGVDPGQFSRKLLDFTHETLKLENSRSRESNSYNDEYLYGALQGAMSSLKDESIGGGTTCVLGALDETEELLHLFILGDSGVMVLRPGLRKVGHKRILHPRVVFRSVEQTHYFNCPFQLSSEDPTPNPVLDDADRVQVRLKENDLIIAATDGVFDNVFDTQIQNMVSAFFVGYESKKKTGIAGHLDALAGRIVKLARNVGENEESGVTPFTINARQDGLDAPGGKLDDATVVLGLVVRPTLIDSADLQCNFD